MDYAQALGYLDSFVNFEKNVPTRVTRASITLDRVRELAERLGNPQNRFPSIHVAGTKGKGSTCAFAASLLRAAGLKVGLYVSPHLQDIRERITINGQMIPEAAFARHVESCRPAVEDMRNPPQGQRKPTYFEVLTHIAFAWFAEEKVDVGVIEVGLGGRLDATNIITPVVCAITHISYDHMAMLGDTLDLIAREKAGILKPGIPAVIAPQSPEALNAIEDCAKKVNCSIEVAGRDFTYGEERLPWLPDVWPGCVGLLTLPGNRHMSGVLGLKGAHQIQNWAVAARAADLFLERTGRNGLTADEAATGAAEVVWPGRLERCEPGLILDGAHNDHSLRVVLSELDRALPNRRPRVVLFGCAKDKDAGAMLDALADRELGVDHVVFTHSGNARGTDPAELAADWLRRTGREAPACVDCASGLAAARNAAGAKGVVLATGSLYLVGAIKDLLATPETR